MNPSLELAHSAIELEQALRLLQWRFCFIGGIAVQHWGEPRHTIDLDLTLLTGFGGEADYIRQLTSLYVPRRIDMLEFAVTNRVVLLRDKRGTPLDISLGGMPFEERAIERAIQMPVLGEQRITICSASDLIVHKVFAARERDWLDVRGILIRSQDQIDWRLVEWELRPLLELKGSTEDWNRLVKLKQSIESVPQA